MWNLNLLRKSGIKAKVHLHTCRNRFDDEGSAMGKFHEDRWLCSHGKDKEKSGCSDSFWCPSLFKSIYLCVYMCMRAGVRACVSTFTLMWCGHDTTCIGRSEDNTRRWSLTSTLFQIFCCCLLFCH